jgi:hypothetical protein
LEAEPSAGMIVSDPQASGERGHHLPHHGRPARWLASPAAGHVTAQIIQVNGGAERGR